MGIRQRISASLATFFGPAPLRTFLTFAGAGALLVLMVQWIIAETSEPLTIHSIKLVDPIAKPGTPINAIASYTLRMSCDLVELQTTFSRLYPTEPFLRIKKASAGVIEQGRYNFQRFSDPTPPDMEPGVWLLEGIVVLEGCGLFNSASTVSIPTITFIVTDLDVQE